jgi:hypothetical protein
MNLVAHSFFLGVLTFEAALPALAQPDAQKFLRETLKLTQEEVATLEKGFPVVRRK